MLQRDFIPTIEGSDAGEIMGDPGFVPGLIGVLLQMTISQIVLHISRFRRWKKLLADLKDTLERIKPIVDLALNNQDEVLVVDNWFRELYALLKQASEIVEKCTTIQRWDVLSGHQTSTKISAVTKDIDKHIAMSGLVHMVQFQVKIQEILDGNKQVIEAVAAHSVSASISQPDHQPVGRINSKKGDKTVTGTAGGLSNLSGVSSFQDQQLEYLDFVSHDVEEEEDRNENQRFGKVLCNFPARYDNELNLTAEEKVEILEEQGEWFYVSKKQPGTNTKVAGWVPMLFVNPSYNSFSVATTKHLQGDKIVTGTASRPSNVSKVSSFQDEQLGYLLSRDGAPSYESTIMQIYELSENSIAGQGSVSDVEEEDCTENQRFGQVLCDFPACCDDELNLIDGEEVEILEDHGEWLYVSKKWLGRGGKMAGWVPALFVNSSCRKS